ncbi:hypothetical protein Lal_00035291 [Lupinus albus]|nr:hypothetical protein Lal_00035291 [Lupinus albus]
MEGLRHRAGRKPKGPAFTNGPTSRNPWARPTSIPLKSGLTAVLYAGRLDKYHATKGLDVTGVQVKAAKRKTPSILYHRYNWMALTVKLNCLLEGKSWRGEEPEKPLGVTSDLVKLDLSWLTIGEAAAMA